MCDFLAARGTVSVALYPGVRDYYNGTGSDHVAVANGCPTDLTAAVTPQMYTVRVYSLQGSTFQATFFLEVNHP